VNHRARHWLDSVDEFGILCAIFPASDPTAKGIRTVTQSTPISLPQAASDEEL
jgi:hypothetical protein